MNRREIVGVFQDGDKTPDYMNAPRLNITMQKSRCNEIQEKISLAYMAQSSTKLEGVT
jgi:hypothetical protein